MTRRLLAAFVAVATLVALTGCPNSNKTNGNKTTNGVVPESANTGPDLFTYADYRPAKTEGRTPEPITVPNSNVVIVNKYDLTSRVDGTVRWIGVELTPAEAAEYKKAVYHHPRTKKTYRRLQPGEMINTDQVVVLLDDEHSYLEFEGATTKAETAAESAKAYATTVEKLKQLVTQAQHGFARGVVPQQEVLNTEATLARYMSEKVDHEGSAKVAAKEAAKAEHVWHHHFLKPAAAGEVQLIHKHEGEGVKAGQEPLITVHEFTTLRAVGNLPREYVTAISKGDEVMIEVAQDVGANAGLTFGQHTTSRPIAAVAVGVANGKPVIVSAGEDGRVYAWDRDLQVLGTWHQPNGVRSLAVTRPDAGAALALVGGVNGTATVYDLANPQAKGREFEGRHDGGVAAAAFSPDGRFCVTADERAIHMYETATGKRKYTFPTREHHSPVTSLNFTPQGRVISAGREPSVRVWMVGQGGARVEHRIDARSGDVPALSVTDDGSRLLLDADKTRLDVIHLQDMRKERPLATAGEAGRFTTFAAWSPELDKQPDNRRIATTGGAEGVVHLWRAPTPDARGAEVARFFTGGSATATSAAFSPQADNPFLVVGTRRGEVHLWSVPTGATVQSEVPAKVTQVEQSIESSGRTVNVLVNFDNPKPGDKYLLRPGTAVTLVIRPKK